MKQSHSFRVALVAVFGLLPASMASALQILGGETVSSADPIASTTVAIINLIEKQGDTADKKKEGFALCTGSIIARDLILTAGHCVGPDKANMRVAFRQDLHGPGPIVAVEDFVRSPGFYSNKDNHDENDIALIRITSGLPQGYTVAVPLSPRNQAVLENGAEVVLAGYGRATREEMTNGVAGADGSGVLRKVSVTISNAAFARTEVLMDQSDGKGACHGDSGGPAFFVHDGHYYLFGVTSRGLPNPGHPPGGCDTDVVYTNMLTQMKFISKAARLLRAPKGAQMPSTTVATN